MVRVEFRVTIFHCPHWQTTALPKAFRSYIIPFYWVLSSMGVVRHHWLGHDYWAAISCRLGFIALSRLGGVYLFATHDAFRAEDRKPVPSSAG